MAGIFDYFSEPQLKRAESARGETIIDAPLLLGVQRLQERYHKKATKSTAMDVTVTSPDFKKLMKQFGKKQKHSISGKPISILVTNTAQRLSSDNEKSRGFGSTVYYAKFIEFGYTRYVGILADGSYKNRRNQTAVSSVPKFIPGLRLFEKSKNAIKSIMATSFQSMPDKYDRDSLYEAMEKAGAEIGAHFRNISPLSQDRDKRTVLKFSQAWSAKVIDSATGEESVVFGHKAIDR